MMLNREPTLVERMPVLIKIFGSPHPLLNLVAVIPVAILFAIIFWTGFDRTISWTMVPKGILIFVLAWLYWTFFEYAMHRWIYHGRYQNRAIREFIYSFHIYHHQNLEDGRVITAGPLMIVMFSLVLVGPLFLLIRGSEADLGLFGFCVVLNYYFYEWIHHLIHKSKLNNFYLKFITEYHMHHHEKNWQANFGNTTSLWDHVFRTFESHS